MAIYALDEEADLGVLPGRRAFPSKFRKAVVEKYGARCNLCDTAHSVRSLSLDHRVPYIVGGEPETLVIQDFQLLCASHQRKKSWECEHCPNRNTQNNKVCRSCFWAYPDTGFTHVAILNFRRLDLTFTGSDDIALYEGLRKLASHDDVSLACLVKRLIRDFIDK